MEKFWEKLKEQMAAQTKEITEAVTRNVTESINEKLITLIEENKSLKTDVKNLQDKIKYMEEERRKNNLIFFGVKEEHRRESPIEHIIKIIEEDMNIHINSHEINNAYKLGEKSDNKTRPILVNFTTNWRKKEILKNKKKLNADIYIKEDYSKEILQKRKQLLSQLEEERAKGKICYFLKDKLVIKDPKEDLRDKRKRDRTDSPIKSPNQVTKPAPKKVNKTNILDYVARSRSSSLSLPTTSKNC